VRWKLAVAINLQTTSSRVDVVLILYKSTADERRRAAAMTLLL
jgi:hypothetical protein